jgi:cysteinyl-tRNA synthetase
MNLIIGLRGEARLRKDFAASDRIRDELKKAGIILKDTKDGVQWESI